MPYRDAKLTRLLQDSLSGGGSVALVVTLRSEAPYVDETIGTLRFAQRAKAIPVRLHRIPAAADGTEALRVLLRSTQVCMHSHRNHTAITPQSHRDHTAITPRSHRDHTAITPQSHRDHTAITPQSHRDHTHAPLHTGRARACEARRRASTAADRGASGGRRWHLRAWFMLTPASHASRAAEPELADIACDPTAGELGRRVMEGRGERGGGGGWRGWRG